MNNKENVTHAKHIYSLENELENLSLSYNTSESSSVALR